MDQSARPTAHQLLARRRRERALRRRLVVRRLGALAAILAVPAIAAETAFDPAIEQAPARPVEPMGFETPGESFPGSAFYYLDDVPQVDSAFVPTRTPAPLARPASLAPSPVGPAAAAMVAMGSGRDIARAQECLATAIYYEAASESDAGQRAVAQVVLNRVAHSAWPNTVCGVVYQGASRQTGCQFSFTCDGSLARRPSRVGWERASRIAREALAGVVYQPVGLSTHYHTLAVHPYWADSLKRTAVIGAHVFYRWPGAAGDRAAFSFAYAGGEPPPGRAASREAGPDPAALARAASPAQAQGTQASAAAMPATDPAPAPASDAATTAAPGGEQAASGPLLPASGRVRREYANSGRWIQQP